MSLSVSYLKREHEIAEKISNYSAKSCKQTKSVSFADVENMKQDIKIMKNIVKLLNKNRNTLMIKFYKLT